MSNLPPPCKWFFGTTWPPAQRPFGEGPVIGFALVLRWWVGMPMYMHACTWCTGSGVQVDGVQVDGVQVCTSGMYITAWLSNGENKSKVEEVSSICD